MAAPPSPAGHPLLGNTIQYLRDPVAFHADHVRTVGDVVRIDLAGRSFHYVTHPEDIKRILVDDHDSFRKASAVRETSGSFGSEGLFFTEGEQWRRQRTLSQPAFYRERVEEYASFAVEGAREVADGWRDGQQVRIDEESKALTLGVLARTLFGVDVRADPETGRVVRETAEAINDRLDATSLVTFLPNWVPTPRDRRFRSQLDTFESTVAELVADRRTDPDPPDDLLTFFVRARDDGDLTARELADQLVTFLFAGHETTSLALTYTCYLLAGHPEVQARVHEELASVLDGDPSVEQFSDLTYTGAVIEESMRLFPPVYMVLREPTREVRLRGYALGPGDTLVLPQRIVQSDPRWWDAPDEFRPARWLGDEDPHTHEYAYFPFGGGPRHCIGMRFARLELKAALATLCRRVEFANPPEELPLSFAVTLQPGTDVELMIRER
jgi:cytochrome P450